MKNLFAWLGLACLSTIASAENEWRNLGIEGGAINGVVMTPDGQTLFAASSGGLYRSDDQCGSWSLISESLTMKQLMQSPINERLYTIKEGSGILMHSTDHGQSWATLSAPDHYYAHSVYPDLHQDGVLYLIATPDDNSQTIGMGLFRSDDHGNSWALQHTFEPFKQIVSQLVLGGKDSTVLYAIESDIFAGTQTLVRSTDEGVTWTILDVGDPKDIGDPEGVLSSIIVSPLNADQVYFNFTSGVFSSTDAGASWTKLPNIANIAGIRSHDGQLFGLASASLGLESPYPINPYVQTPADGSTFAQLNLAITNGQMQHIVFDPSNAQIGYSGTYDLGMMKTSDGGASWQRCNQGLTAGYLSSVSHHPTKPDTFSAFGDSANVFTTADAGKNWTHISLEAHIPFGQIRYEPSQPDTLYAKPRSASNFSISTDAGNSFLITDCCNAAAQFAVSPLNANQLFMGTLLSLDGGLNWQTPTEWPLQLGETLYTAYDQVTPNALVGMTLSGATYYSQDAGQSWTAGNDTLPVTTAPIAGHQAGTFYQPTFMGLYKTIDGGKHWNQITTQPTLLIAVDPKHSNTLYAMLMDGIYLSQDGGNSFTFVTEPPLGAAPATQEFLVDPTNSQRLIAATLGGLYAYEQTTDDCTTHVKYDQNCDGKADIVWRNATSGQNWYHAMDGHLVTTSSPINTVNQPWRIIGRGDFDGDGKSDLLWRNDESGLNYLYLMDGNTILSGKPVYQVPVDSGWDIISVADYNGDGKDDMLWRNANDGLIWQYQMDGANIIKSQRVTTLSDLQWQLVASPDLNGDGKADLLWRHQGNGLVWKYLMDGHLISSNGKIMQVPLDWQLVIAGDFDGDHDADLLWRNTTDGRNYVYLLDQGVVNWSNRGLISQFSDQNWHAVMAGDFDGDGDDDIFWRHAGDGRNYMYLMDGKNYQGKTVGRIADLNWQPVQ